MVLYSVLGNDRLVEVVAGVGAAGLLLCVVALAGRWPAVIPFGLAGVGASYALFLSLRERVVDSHAPLVAAALFAAAELAFWSIEPRVGGDRAVVARRVVYVCLGALGAGLLGGILLLLTAGVSGGVVLEAVGVVSAVVALAIVTRLAARARTA